MGSCIGEPLPCPAFWRRKPRSQDFLEEDQSPLEWLALLDGAPLVTRAKQLTGRQQPRPPGNDLIEPILNEAERCGFRLGSLAGTREADELIHAKLARERSGPHRVYAEQDGRSGPAAATLRGLMATLRSPGYGGLRSIRIPRAPARPPVQRIGKGQPVNKLNTNLPRRLGRDFLSRTFLFMQRHSTLYRSGSDGSCAKS